MEYKEYQVHSDAYDLDGIITEYHWSTELEFQYNDKTVNIAIERPFPFSEGALIEHGRQVMETYIEKLLSGEIKERRLMLHYWYIKEVQDGEDTYLSGRGIVTGHDRLADATPIHTSEVINIEIDKEAEELILHTRNSVYYCPFIYCNFHRQEKEPQLVPEFEQLKKQYQGKIIYPKIEPGKVLLVLSNFNEYYFNSLYYQPEGEEEPLEYDGQAHIGTFQDSYLVSTDDYRIDLRYFPHYQNIQFYAEGTDGRPWYIENIGDITLYARTSAGVLRLEPGDRKEVTKENAEKGEPILPGGDLYPAGFLG